MSQTARPVLGGGWRGPAAPTGGSSSLLLGSLLNPPQKKLGGSLLLNQSSLSHNPALLPPASRAPTPAPPLGGAGTGLSGLTKASAEGRLSLQPTMEPRALPKGSIPKPSVLLNTHMGSKSHAAKPGLQRWGDVPVSRGAQSGPRSGGRAKAGSSTLGPRGGISRREREAARSESEAEDDLDDEEQLSASESTEAMIEQIRRQLKASEAKASALSVGGALQGAKVAPQNELPPVAEGRQYVLSQGDFRSPEVWLCPSCRQKFYGARVTATLHIEVCKGRPAGSVGVEDLLCQEDFDGGVGDDENLLCEESLDGSDEPRKMVLELDVAQRDTAKGRLKREREEHSPAAVEISSSGRKRRLPSALREGFEVGERAEKMAMVRSPAVRIPKATPKPRVVPVPLTNIKPLHDLGSGTMQLDIQQSTESTNADRQGITPIRSNGRSATLVVQISCVDEPAARRLHDLLVQQAGPPQAYAELAFTLVYSDTEQPIERASNLRAADYIQVRNPAGQPCVTNNQCAFTLISYADPNRPTKLPEGAHYTPDKAAIDCFDKLIKITVKVATNVSSVQHIANPGNVRTTASNGALRSFRWRSSIDFCLGDGQMTTYSTFSPAIEYRPKCNAQYTKVKSPSSQLDDGASPTSARVSHRLQVKQELVPEALMALGSWSPAEAPEERPGTLGRRNESPAGDRAIKRPSDDNFVMAGEVVRFGTGWSAMEEDLLNQAIITAEELGHADIKAIAHMALPVLPGRSVAAIQQKLYKDRKKRLEYDESTCGTME